MLDVTIYNYQTVHLASYPGYRTRIQKLKVPVSKLQSKVRNSTGKSNSKAIPFVAHHLSEE